MNLKDIVASQPANSNGKGASASPNRSARQPVNTLEYELITHLVQQQFQKDDQVRFDLLLAIPLPERIPGLLQEFGMKRMHQLLVMLIKAFCFALPIPKTKKLTDTKISAIACDLVLVAQEDQLSLEDVILFFERAKAGKYGAIKILQHHHQLMDLLQQYRQERHDAFMKIKEEQNQQLKTLGPADRTCVEPKPIGEVMNQAFLVDMKKRMSG